MITLKKFKQFAALKVEIHDNPDVSKLAERRMRTFLGKLSPIEQETVDRFTDIDWLRQFSKDHPYQ